MSFELRNSIRIICIAALYFAAAIFGLTWAVPGTSATPLWPPAGIAAASLLLFGLPVWPGVFIGAFAANMTHFIQIDHLSSMGIFAGSTAIGVGNLFEALVVYFLCKNVIGSTQPLDEVTSIFKFVPIAALACLIAATIGTATMLGLRLEIFANSGLIFSTWWLGDTLAILIVTPLLISWWPIRRHGKGYRWLELVAAFAALLLFCEIVFGRHIELEIFNAQPALVIPLLLWLAIRFSQRELVSGVALVSIIAIYATVNGRGPFVDRTLNASFLSEQLFSALLAITMLVLSAAVRKSDTIQRALQAANEALEDRVTERTEALEKKTRILEAINNQLLIEARERLSAETELQNLKDKKP